MTKNLLKPTAKEKYKLDPRSKMMMVVSVSTLSMLTKSLTHLAIILVSTIALTFLVKTPIEKFELQIKGVLKLIVSLFIIQGIFSRIGEPLLVIKGITILTKGGLELSLMLNLRILIIVISSLLLYGESRDYILALVQMKIPFEIAFMTMASIRFIPTLKEETLNVYYAIQMRGTEVSNENIIKRLKIYSKITFPILVLAINRAKHMAIAMEMRAFRAYPQRTYMRSLKLRLKDKLIIVTFIFITSIFVVLKFS